MHAIPILTYIGIHKSLNLMGLIATIVNSSAYLSFGTFCVWILFILVSMQYTWYQNRTERITFNLYTLYMNIIVTNKAHPQISFSFSRSFVCLVFLRVALESASIPSTECLFIIFKFKLHCILTYDCEYSVRDTRLCLCICSVSG